MTEATLVFDIGKTNKKRLLFDAAGNVLDEQQAEIPGFSGPDDLLHDDAVAIWNWMLEELERLGKSREYSITGLNVTTFGATVAHLHPGNELAIPVLSYENTVPDEIEEAYQNWMEAEAGGFAAHATPILPQMLIVGKQLFWLARTRPEVAENIALTLFLPQYFIHKLTGVAIMEPTGLGAHTGMWNFHERGPSATVLGGLDWTARVPKLVSHDDTRLSLKPEYVQMLGRETSPVVGAGLHDSSSALIPFSRSLQKKFILVSTGTWIIVLQPGAAFAMTDEDLQRDRLYYLTPAGDPVRAARLFAGREHELQLQRIRDFFGKPPRLEAPDLIPFLLKFFNETEPRWLHPRALAGSGPFPHCPPGEWQLRPFASAEEAYARLLLDLAVLTAYCVEETETNSVEAVVVDGGFARNEAFMRILTMLLQPREVFTADVPQATALGAALAVQGPADSKAPAAATAALNPIRTEQLAGLRLYAERYLSWLDSSS